MEGTPLLKVLESSLAHLSRAERRNVIRLLKEEAKKVERILLADGMNGAGYPTDRLLRRILGICNDDLMNGLDVPFANVWDVMSGFVRVEQAQMTRYARLLPERDHAFTATDFFAFAGEEQLREQTVPRLAAIPEGTIHNYSVLGDVKEIVFEEEGRDPVVFAGISMVRHGRRIHWMTCGGIVTDISKVTEERRALIKEQEAQIRAANPHASEQMLQDTLNPYAVPLEGTDDVWMHFAMGLFNLDTLSQETRIVGKDWGVSLSVFSDQFEERFAGQYETDQTMRNLVDKAVAEVESSRLLFDVAETAFTLPAYFAAKVSLVTEKEIQTELGGPGKNPKKKYALKAPSDMRILMRRVTTLDFGRGRHISHSYAPPRFRVEVDGFWRRLKPDATGHDPDGNPVKGRTWVRGHARWKDLPPKTGVVYVKSPIRSALERAEEEVREKGGAFRLTT